MDKTLKLFKKDGTSSLPFPDGSRQIEMLDFTYTSRRMGSAPSIEGSVMFKDSLDALWDDSVFVEFRGERYYLTGTPTSSYSNEDTRYRYELRFLSERSRLENVYFYDVTTDTDTYTSQSSRVTFYGNLAHFVTKLNYALGYSGIGYTASVSDVPDTDEKMFQFEDKHIIDVLNDDCYNAFKVPYYFVGKVIHFGEDTGHSIDTPFRYGINDSLLKITRTNTNEPIINKCTGYGSSENIPYYYPNLTSTGNHSYTTSFRDRTLSVRSIDYDVLAQYVNLWKDKKLVYFAGAAKGSMIGIQGLANVQIAGSTIVDYPFSVQGKSIVSAYMTIGTVPTASQAQLKCIGNNRIKFTFTIPKGNFVELIPTFRTYSPNGTVTDEVGDPRVYSVNDGGETEVTLTKYNDRWAFYASSDSQTYRAEYEYIAYINYGTASRIDISSSFSLERLSNESQNPTLNDDESSVKIPLSSSGIVFSDASKLVNGDYIVINADGGWVEPQDRLLPWHFRNNGWTDRFLPEYEEGQQPDNPIEHIEVFDDIKPSITGITNSDYDAIDEFEDVAFDDSDTNDYTIKDGQKVYTHPYFFVKLRRFDGTDGFNLFDHASTSDVMSICPTTGACGGCTFEIGVGEEDEVKNRNLVQVDENGDLLRDEDGNVRCGREGMPKESPQDIQNDTRNAEVWIALKKDTSTYGTIMPSITGTDSEGERTGLVPVSGDRFVITGINLPQAYIYAAEKRLDAAIQGYLDEHGSEAFTFAIDFSRIFFAENENMLSLLTESSKIKIAYPIGATEPVSLYVTSYTYKMESGYHLPQIGVELSDEVRISKTVMRQIQESVVKTVILETGASSPSRSQSMRPSTPKDLSSYVKKNEDDSITFNMIVEKAVTRDKLSDDVISYIETLHLPSTTLSELAISDKEFDETIYQVFLDGGYRVKGYLFNGTKKDESRPSIVKPYQILLSEYGWSGTALVEQGKLCILEREIVITGQIPDLSGSWGDWTYYGDGTVKANSPHPVTSGAVYEALQSVGGDKTYEHIQSEAAYTWTIVHNLNKYPSVTVIDSNKNEVFGNVTYTSKNELEVKFTSSFSGKAFCN